VTALASDRDPLPIMVAWLRATGLEAAIYGGISSPPPLFDPRTNAAICVTVRGGTDDYTGAFKVVSYQFAIWGTGQEYYEQVVSANTLAAQLHNRLQDELSYTMHARRETLPTTIEDQATGWPYVLTFYQIMLSQIAEGE